MNNNEDELRAKKIFFWILLAFTFMMFSLSLPLGIVMLVGVTYLFLATWVVTKVPFEKLKSGEPFHWPNLTLPAYKPRAFSPRDIDTWVKLEQACAHQQVVQGSVTGAVRGGLQIDLGLPGFLAKYGLDGPLVSANNLKVSVRVAKIDRKGGRIEVCLADPVVSAGASKEGATRLVQLSSQDASQDASKTKTRLVFLAAIVGIKLFINIWLRK